MNVRPDEPHPPPIPVPHQDPDATEPSIMEFEDHLGSDGYFLTPKEQGQIVRASLAKNRILGGIEGHEGSGPDVLLVLVEGIVRRHVEEALRR